MNSKINITFEDLKLSTADAKLIADGAAVFMRPTPDPEDSERFRVDEPPAAANLP